MSNKLIVKGPTDPVDFSIYRIDVGQFVYIGHTRDIYDRASRHSKDLNRIVGRLFGELGCDMYVEHIDAASSKQQARELERLHIEAAKEVHGELLLNVQHTRGKKK